MKGRYRMTPRKWVGIVAAVAIVVGVSFAWYTTAKAPTSTQPKTAAKQEAKAALNPLEIEAIRQRSYPGSAITTESDQGDKGTYHNYVVSFRSDNLKEYALASIPNSAAPTGGYPVVILDHGYIDPAQYRTTGSDYQSWIATLAGAGFVVIKPDYRGHGQSEGIPEGGHYSPVYTYDQLNLIASLKQWDKVNAKRVGQLGHSLGAHTALRTAVVSKDVKASVYVSGVVGSLYDFQFNWPNSPAASDLPAVVQTNAQDLKQKYGDAKTNPDFWNKVSAINYVDAVTGPSEINYGLADTVVPQLFSDHLRDALVKAHKPVDYYTYPGADHQFSQSNARSLFLQRTVAFFQENL